VVSDDFSGFVHEECVRLGVSGIEGEFRRIIGCGFAAIDLDSFSRRFKQHHGPVRNFQSCIDSRLNWGLCRA